MDQITGAKGLTWTSGLVPDACVVGFECNMNSLLNMMAIGTDCR